MVTLPYIWVEFIFIGTFILNTLGRIIDPQGLRLHTFLTIKNPTEDFKKILGTGSYSQYQGTYDLAG